MVNDVTGMDSILRPVLGNGRAPLESHVALRTRLPATQGLLTYESNVFRDWCWGGTYGGWGGRIGPHGGVVGENGGESTQGVTVDGWEWRWDTTKSGWC